MTDTVRLPVGQIAVDPDRFQFKANVDADGVSPELKGITTFEPDAEGVIAVWHDAGDGRTYVVNGHHRLELAQRTGYQTLRCRYLDAATAGEARMRGATINLREGRGTAVDAAKLFRDAHLTPADLSRLGISTVGATVAQQGLALARLHPTLFRRVVIGSITIARGVLIGQELREPSEQLGLLSLLDDDDGAVTDAELAELIRHARTAGSTTSTQTTLFGAETRTDSLALPRAKVSSYVREHLQHAQRACGFVGRSAHAGELREAGNQIDSARSQSRATAAAQLLELFEKLSTKVGPVSALLTDGARQLASALDADLVKRATLTSVVTLLSAQHAIPFSIATTASAAAGQQLNLERQRTIARRAVATRQRRSA